MNMLKKGPELKLPDLKVPDFALDIYYDLRERHLLPLVAILLVALVALPIVLSGGSSSDASGESESARSRPPAPCRRHKLVVAKAAPGLREYKHRLAGRHAQDPFIQQYASPEGGAGGAGTGEIPSEGGEEPPTPAESTEPSGATETTPPRKETENRLKAGTCSTTRSRSIPASCR